MAVLARTSSDFHDWPIVSQSRVASENSHLVIGRDESPLLAAAIQLRLVMTK
jgi:hypothetical protein